MLQARDFIEAALTDQPPTAAIDLRKEFDEVGIGDVLAQLDHELIGLKPVKTRIREIASLLLIERVRKQIEPDVRNPDLAHVVHRQSRDRKDHGGACGSPASFTSSASSAAARSYP